MIPYALHLCKESVTSSHVTEVFTRHGFRMRVDVDEWLGRHIYVTGEYEPSTTAVIKKILKPGNTFVDVGANAGYFTLLASKAVGKSGKVFSFEPLPSVRNSLLEQISLNKFSNCTVFDFAASDTEQEIQFYAGPPDHLGTSSLRRLENYQEMIQVKCRKLDDILRSSGKIHAIKIDVEGAEFLALKGAQRLIQDYSPTIILEVTPEYLEQLGSTVNEVNDYLCENNYRLLAITHKQLIELDHISEFQSKQFNLLAVHRDASSDWITSDLL